MNSFESTSSVGTTLAGDSPSPPPLHRWRRASARSLRSYSSAPFLVFRGDFLLIRSPAIRKSTHLEFLPPRRKAARSCLRDCAHLTDLSQTGYGGDLRSGGVNPATTATALRPAK